MSDDKADAPKYEFGVPVVIVKGGTSTGAYDREREKRKADAEMRRAQLDEQMAAGRQGATVDQSGFTLARLGSARMVTEHSPRLVLYYMNRDHTVRQECKSEITTTEHPTDPARLDMTFALVCPRCLERGEPQGESQMLVRESHRKFWIDERTKGSVIALRDPWGNLDPVIICGTVTVQDIVRCKNYNCNYAVRINDSKVYEV